MCGVVCCCCSVAVVYVWREGERERERECPKPWRVDSAVKRRMEGGRFFFGGGGRSLGMLFVFQKGKEMALLDPII